MLMDFGLYLFLFEASTNQCTFVKQRQGSVEFVGNFSMSPMIKGRVVRDESGSCVRALVGGMQ